MAELQVATVGAQIALSRFTDFENFTVFKPVSYHQRGQIAGRAVLIPDGS